jgi:hypothetical protein
MSCRSYDGAGKARSPSAHVVTLSTRFRTPPATAHPDR